MNFKRILTLLGFAAKSGKLSYGFDAALTSLKKKKTKLIIAAGDISEKTYKEISYFASTGGTKHISLEGIDIKTLSDAIGKRCGVVSVNDEGFAKACYNAFIEGGNANDQ